MSEGPPYEVRKTWTNHLGNQSIDPLRIYTPRSIDEVVTIVRAAEAAGVGARAVGSGHSWSDVALTDGFLIKTDGLARAPAPEPDFLQPAWERRKLARVEAGIRLKELNDYLDGIGLGLSQMGGYDHQTVAGVISTSTHGSGITYGPLNDNVALARHGRLRGPGRARRACGRPHRARRLRGPPRPRPHADRRRRRLQRGRRRHRLHGDRLHGAARGPAQVPPARGARDAPVGEGPRGPRGRRGAARQRALRARLQPVQAQARVPVPRDDPQHRRRPAQPAMGQAHAQLDRGARGAAAVHLAAAQPRLARHAEPRSACCSRAR